MKLMIPFKNPKTGEVKFVKCGFSWTLLAFSCFGVPLFLRKLNLWGCIFLLFWVICSILPNITVLFFFMILQIWIAFKGNQMTARNYLEQGWILAEPSSELTKAALKQWGFSPEQASLNPSDTGIPATAPSAPTAAYIKQKQNIPAWQGLLIIVAVLYCLFALIKHGGGKVIEASQREARSARQHSENLVLPSCDSEEIKQTLIDAAKNSPAGRTVGIEILDIKQQRQVNADDRSRFCNAAFYTNAGAEALDYSIMWVDKAEGSYYVSMTR